MEELEPNKLNEKPSDRSVAVEIISATFAWDAVSKPALDGSSTDDENSGESKKKNTKKDLGTNTKTTIYNPKGNLHENPTLFQEFNGGTGSKKKNSTFKPSEAADELDELNVSVNSEESKKFVDVLFDVDITVKKVEIDTISVVNMYIYHRNSKKYLFDRSIYIIFICKCMCCVTGRVVWRVWKCG